MKDGTIQFSRLPGDGVQLHVAQSGRGSPVLLLHGFPDHWRLWEPLIRALAPFHQMMAPDLRGINLSDKPPAVADYDIAHLVNDVLALIDHLGGRCALVGHDWGGLLAWSVAALHPARVSRLVVFNAPHPCRFAEQLKSSQAQRDASQYALRLCQAGVEDRLAANGHELLWAVRSAGRCGVARDAESDANRDAERQACVQAWSQPGALTAAVNWYRALNLTAAFSQEGVRSVPDLGSVSGVVAAPTLVVWGERDGSFPVDCLDGLDRWVPDLRIHREADGGHWLLEERPALAASLLSEFLAEDA